MAVRPLTCRRLKEQNSFSAKNLTFVSRALRTSLVVGIGHEARLLQALGGNYFVLLLPVFVVRRHAVVRQSFQHFHHGDVSQFLRYVQRRQAILRTDPVNLQQFLIQLLYFYLSSRKSNSSI